VRDGAGQWWVREGRRVRAGDEVVVGVAEDGREGVVVHAQGFVGEDAAQGDFHFMSSQVSREKPIDYAAIARMLVREKRRGGYVLWVTGPALVHSRARDNLVWFIRNGYVQELLAGNAVAVHDIEAAIVGTTLGMTSQGEPTPGGHAAHMRAINAVRRAGSIRAAVVEGLITEGIMHACVVEEIPYVLAGSLRDDGPLPDVLTDMVAAQEATRAHTIKATMAVMIATALHSIAVGNMLPAYYEDPQRGLCELPTICVDASEFLVSKLKDRGTHQAVGVVTNAQDFMSILRAAVEREVVG
jgi:lysine-ketoglutarate reductase/saccharopine dehydrogenase-like protein (TIGR00300 family)